MKVLTEMIEWYNIQLRSTSSNNIGFYKVTSTNHQLIGNEARIPMLLRQYSLLVTNYISGYLRQLKDVVEREPHPYDVYL